jgi:hypothetical protein
MLLTKAIICVLVAFLQTAAGSANAGSTITGKGRTQTEKTVPPNRTASQLTEDLQASVDSVKAVNARKLLVQINIETRMAESPRGIVYGLLKYALVLASIFKDIHRGEVKPMEVRESAANSLPEFLIDVVWNFKNRLQDTFPLRSAVDETLQQAVRVHLVPDPEKVLCLRSLLSKDCTPQCYMNTASDICARFSCAKGIIQEFIVAYRLVKRLSDVIYAIYLNYTGVDGMFQEAFDEAIRGAHFNPENGPELSDDLWSVLLTSRP